MIWQNLKSGFLQVRANKRMIAVFYLANLFFGLLLLLPLRAIMKNFIGDSTIGAGSLDMDFLFEFFRNNIQFFSVWSALVLIVPAANWLFAIFLSGGAFAVFAKNKKYEAVLFWGSAAKYFGRFLRLALWSLPLLAVLFCVPFIVNGIEMLIFGSDPYQNIAYWSEWIKAGIRALGFLFFGMILDYARIYAVLTDERKMLIALGEGATFAFKNFLSTFGLAFLLVITGAAALVIYNPLANNLSAPDALIVILLFLLQQFYMIFRATLRLTLYASQLDLYRQLAAAPMPAGITSAEVADINGLAPAAE